MDSAPHSPPRGLTPLVFCLFFGSGAVGLMYELSWVKAITLVFGSTSLAVSTVVSIYMGGLALGAALAGRRADGLANPLTWYGGLEVGLAVYALLTPLLFGSLLPWLGALAGGGGIWTLSVFRFAASGLLLLPPTLIMGATLPILSHFYAQQRGDGGRGAGLLYGVNTVGAFAGTFLAGFVLLGWLGVQNTVLLVAGLNLLLGAGALLLGRLTERGAAGEGAEDVAAEEASDPGEPVELRALAPVLGAVALTGFAALACEVAWTRILAMQLGASVYAFTIVLGTFLAALGLGAALTAAFLRGSPQRAGLVFYGLALASAVGVAVSFVVCGRLPGLFLELYTAWGFKDDPDAVIRAQLGLAAAVVFAPTLLMGGLFAAALRVTVDRAQRTARAVSRLYLANTLGSVLGSFAAGFALIPLLGMRGTLVVAMVGQCLGGALVVQAQPGRRAGVLAGVAIGLGLLLPLLTPPWAPYLMASGVFKYAPYLQGLSNAELQQRMQDDYELLFYEDGLTATITVFEDKQQRGQLILATNGKFDGSSHGDMPTQRLLAHLPLLFHPQPRSACVIGLGTACTLASARRHDLEDLACVEIEQAVVNAARSHFGPHNDQVLDDPEVDLQVTDGRLFLELNPGRFDVLISEPSNPWLAGVGHLFTREFFQAGRDALRSGGVFAQWLQLYGLSFENLRMVLRTFHEVFPHIYVFSTMRATDLVLLGSEQPLRFDLPELNRRMAPGPVAEDLRDPRVAIRSPIELLSRFRMGPRELEGLIGEGPLHTDDLPLLSYVAPRDLYRDTREPNCLALAEYASGVLPYLSGLPAESAERESLLVRYAALKRSFLETPSAEEEAAELLLAGDGPSRFPRPFDVPAAADSSRQATELAKQGRPAEAVSIFEQALSLDPNSPTVAGNLSHAYMEQGDPQAALRAAEWALAVDPYYALGHGHRGYALVALGRIDEALAAYRRALELAPKTPGLQATIESLEAQTQGD